MRRGRARAGGGQQSHRGVAGARGASPVTLLPALAASPLPRAANLWKCFSRLGLRHVTGGIEAAASLGPASKEVQRYVKMRAPHPRMQSPSFRALTGPSPIPPVIIPPHFFKRGRAGTARRKDECSMSFPAHGTEDSGRARDRRHLAPHGSGRVAQPSALPTWSKAAGTRCTQGRLFLDSGVSLAPKSGVSLSPQKMVHVVGCFETVPRD